MLAWFPPRRPGTETGEFMKSFLLRPLAWLVAILLLPACWGAAVSFGKSIPAAFLAGGAGSYLLAPEGWAFIVGACAYAVWHRLRPPEFLYAFVHEFTHMAFALLTGEKVRSFEVNQGSGKVGLSGTNPLITLAPYFFPLPTVAVLIPGALLGWAFGYPQIGWATAFLSGLTLYLHVLMTFRALGASQPDIARGGRIFSWAFIFFLGFVFIGGAALVAAGGWGVAAIYGVSIWRESWDAYALLFGLMERIAWGLSN
ncbi:MAG: hypothetical protein OXL41_04895 [Nitrospinae bacterium]|nr:hypothetical protein [Nitrospinota bacterium]